MINTAFIHEFLGYRLQIDDCCKSIIEVVNLTHWENPVAVTLTMRQIIPTANGGCEHLDSTSAAENLKHFLNRLNRAFLGNAVRHGKRVYVLAVIERGGDKRYHYHAIIDRPEHIEPAAFDIAVTDCWSKTRWARRQIDIQHGANEGWLQYMLKERTKTNFHDDIDWINAHLPARD